MSFISNFFNKEPKKEIKKDEAKKQGMSLFFSVLWREFWELCKLNLIMMVFCLPVVTIPATVTAVNKVMIFMLLDKPVYTFEDFFQTFKKEWKRATVLGLPYLLLLGLVLFAMYFYSSVYVNFYLYTFSMLGVAVLIIIGFYLFSLLGFIDLDLKSILKDALILTFLRIPQNLLALMGILAVVFVAIMFLPPSIIAILLMFFALIEFIAVFCAFTGIQKYVVKEEDNE